MKRRFNYGRGWLLVTSWFNPSNRDSLFGFQCWRCPGTMLGWTDRQCWRDATRFYLAPRGRTWRSIWRSPPGSATTPFFYPVARIQVNNLSLIKIYILKIFNVSSIFRDAANYAILSKWENFNRDFTIFKVSLVKLESSLKLEDS